MQRAAQALVADSENSAASNGIAVSLLCSHCLAYRCDKKLRYNRLTLWGDNKLLAIICAKTIKNVVLRGENKHACQE